MSYLLGFVPIFLRYRDCKAAHRNGVLHIAIARKNQARRQAARGRRLFF